MRHILEAHIRRTPLIHERQHAVQERMTRHQRHEGITQSTRTADTGPGDAAPFAEGFGTVAVHLLSAPKEAEGDAGGDVQGERGGDEQWFEGDGLVVRTCQEEVGF